MRRHPDLEFQTRVDINRRESMRVLNDIRQGLVNEHDLEMLQNFIQYSLALMQLEGPKKWALAKMNAEMMDIIHRQQQKGESDEGRITEQAG